MKQAVIESGGKQYLVSPRDQVTIEKLETGEGSDVSFDKVLLVADDSGIKIGTPYVAGAKVSAKLVRQQRGEKLVVFKYRAKSKYRRKTGHRQSQTVVQIEAIS